MSNISTWMMNWSDISIEALVRNCEEVIFKTAYEFGVPPDVVAHSLLFYFVALLLTLMNDGSKTMGRDMNCRPKKALNFLALWQWFFGSSEKKDPQEEQVGSTAKDAADEPAKAISESIFSKAWTGLKKFCGFSRASDMRETEENVGETSEVLNLFERKPSVQKEEGGYLSSLWRGIKKWFTGSVENKISSPLTTSSVENKTSSPLTTSNTNVGPALSDYAPDEIILPPLPANLVPAAEPVGADRLEAYVKKMYFDDTGVKFTDSGRNPYVVPNSLFKPYTRASEVELANMFQVGYCNGRYLYFQQIVFKSFKAHVSAHLEALAKLRHTVGTNSEFLALLQQVPPDFFLAVDPRYPLPLWALRGFFYSRGEEPLKHVAFYLVSGGRTDGSASLVWIEKEMASQVAIRYWMNVFKAYSSGAYIPDTEEERLICRLMRECDGNVLKAMFVRDLTYGARPGKVVGVVLPTAPEAATVLPKDFVITSNPHPGKLTFNLVGKTRSQIEAIQQVEQIFRRFREAALSPSQVQQLEEITPQDFGIPGQVSATVYSPNLSEYVVGYTWVDAKTNKVSLCLPNTPSALLYYLTQHDTFPINCSLDEFMGKLRVSICPVELYVQQWTDHGEAYRAVSPVIHGVLPKMELPFRTVLNVEMQDFDILAIQERSSQDASQNQNLSVGSEALSEALTLFFNEFGYALYVTFQINASIAGSVSQTVLFVLVNGIIWFFSVGGVVVIRVMIHWWVYWFSIYSSVGITFLEQWSDDRWHGLFKTSTMRKLLLLYKMGCALLAVSSAVSQALFKVIAYPVRHAYAFLKKLFTSNNG